MLVGVRQGGPEAIVRRELAPRPGVARGQPERLLGLDGAIFSNKKLVVLTLPVPDDIETDFAFMEIEKAVKRLDPTPMRKSNRC